MLGGRIWVESEQGRGSSFHFTAQAKTAVGEPPLRLAGIDSLVGVAVLAVDDNATSRRVLSEMMAGWGMESPWRTAARAREILDRAEREGRPFPLVLADAQMPQMDGFALIRLINRSPALTPPTIVMLTSLGDPAMPLPAGKLARPLTWPSQ